MSNITKKEIHHEIRQAEKGYYSDDYDWHGVDGATLDIDPENDERIIDADEVGAVVKWMGIGTWNEREDDEKQQVEYTSYMTITKQEDGFIVVSDWDLEIDCDHAPFLLDIIVQDITNDRGWSNYD